MKYSKLILAGLLVASASLTRAATVDFNGFSSGTVLSGNNVVSPDFDISSTGGNAVRALGGPNSTIGALEATPRSAYRVDFDISGVSSVSVDIGDFNSDSENIYLQAYDSSNALIGSAGDFLPASLIGYKTLTVNVANIDHIIFGGDNGSVNSVNSVFFDNLTYRASQGVPDAGSSLGLMGLAGLAMSVFRRRSKA